jgi:hypothetical protein
MPKDYIKCVVVIRTEENFEINNMASIPVLLWRDSTKLQNILAYAASARGFEHVSLR